MSKIARMMMTGLLGGSESAAPVVTPWYLAGGIPLANCLSALQPLGAASAAASLVNLAHPGSPNATATFGDALVKFDASYGWDFGKREKVDTAIIPVSGGSMIVRFSDAVADATVQAICGTRLSSSLYTLGFDLATNNQMQYYATVAANRPPMVTEGIVAIANRQPYRNGAADGVVVGGAWAAFNFPILLGGYNSSGTLLNRYDGRIQAWAYYNIDITPYIGALQAAMMALPF